MPEVKRGPAGGYVQAFCHYCGWASQVKEGDDFHAAMEKACALNETHERKHPEWTEPLSLKESIDALRQIDIDHHAAHTCIPGRCACSCGCGEELACTQDGRLCITCRVREVRGDSAHQEVPEGRSREAFRGMAGCLE